VGDSVGNVAAKDLYAFFLDLYIIFRRVCLSKLRFIFVSVNTESSALEIHPSVWRGHLGRPWEWARDHMGDAEQFGLSYFLFLWSILYV
jgi:hypothetical protein